jgi:long-subunit acyl-CoA synthetase (AMP-forming)
LPGANDRLSRVEQIKRYAVVEGEWLPDSDELTPTAKLKRRVIAEKYADEIEAPYAAPRDSVTIPVDTWEVEMG